MRKNPLEQAEYISKEFSNYIKSTFVLKNRKYNADFSNELERSVLTKGPYLKLELPFEKSSSLQELMESGKISSLFSKVNNINFRQPLYKHQYETLVRIGNKESVVVTTGTGSGKTEAFLYPILNELLKKIEQEMTLNGIQAILLYPMNALVNDQLDRLRGILNTVPEITFGYFTGDTPDFYKVDYDNKKSKKISREDYINRNFAIDDIRPPQNELLTREEIRKNPPNILITNYSMLEYLLIRPGDKSILNEKTLSDWSFMVLDEAHSYRGILATEVAHLLKRLQIHAHKVPQFILTSATLGDTKEDKKNIIDFAKKLTSVEYFERSIIYSDRIRISKYSIEYQIETSDYLILTNQTNENQDAILKKYKKENLFDLLVHDRNVHYLAEILRETKTFDDTFYELRKYCHTLQKEELIALISTITATKDKDKNRIYDIKYHFFTRTLEGAFISLEPYPKLMLTNRQKIDESWAFEIGTCKNCNELYIVGRTYDNKLYRSELELDENYQNFDDAKIEFYLIKKDVLHQVEDAGEKFEEYTVCSKCGHIYQNNHIDHPECECGKEYQVELFKIIVDDQDVKNNIKKCAVCGKESHKFGIVNSFKVGKDQATALLSQILLNSMKDVNEEIETKKLSNLFIKYPQVIKSDMKKRQFLAFSDSRQQASFYALFFQENQNKFLRKSIVLMNSETSKIESVVTKIEKIIEDKKLFEDNDKKRISSSKQAYISILLELLKADGNNSLEGLGLLSFEPDFSNIVSSITKENLEEYLPKVKLAQMKDLLCLYTDIFRTVPAINYDDSGLRADDKKEYLGYRRFDNYVKLNGDSNSKETWVKSILPIKEGIDNNITGYMKKTFDLNNDEVREYSSILWNIIQQSRVVDCSDKGGDYQCRVKFSSYKIISKQDSKWYICDKCRTLTTHNINDSCIKGKCSGKLRECNPDIELKDNYYRKEYQSRINESIVVQEHTGQLTREQGKKYQKDFKNKKINVLSSSTTFEMGINIGSLDTVFMRNIPPTSANYAQRAGRAGRSDESVAFILTYANHNSHDQMYFNDPVSMIDGKIKPPIIKLDNKKIAFRHIMAFCFGYFYRNIDTEDTLSNFIETDSDKFKIFITNNKNYIEESLRAILSTENYLFYKEYRWYEEMFNREDSLFIKFLLEVSTEIEKLDLAENDEKEASNYSKAKLYQDQRRNILEMRTIQAFAKYNVIPGYGFPINVVPLKIYDIYKEKYDKKFDLSREMSIAISEYAPDSEIIVDKNKYTSRYINIPREGTLPQYYYYKCENSNCGKVELSNVSRQLEVCPKCGDPIEEHSFVEPIMGFTADENNKESQLIKPRKTYTSDISYLGSIDPYKEDLNVNDFILVQQSIDDRMLVINESPFFSCKICGYTELNIKRKYDIDSYHKAHKNFARNSCNNGGLEKIRLGHIITTDVIKMKINMSMDYETAISTLTAIGNGIIAYLQIDPNDINGTVVKDGINKYAFVFYDTTYGGAGNVKQLTDKDGLYNILKTALTSVSNDCCDEEVSCTNCLRNYRNSRYHKSLKRKYARDSIMYILDQYIVK